MQPRSTKRPLNIRPKTAKNRSNEVLESALEVMESAKKRKVDDAFDVFGRHVGNEIRSLKTNFAQQWAKLKVQEVLFQAQFITDSSPRNQFLQSVGMQGQGSSFTSMMQSPEQTPLGSPVYSQSHEYINQ